MLCFVKVLVDEWIKVFRDPNQAISYQCIESKESFIEILPKLVVLHDLNSTNKHLSIFSSKLIVDLVTYHTGNWSSTKDILTHIYQNLDTILFYSEKNPLSSSKLLVDGFIIDRRFLLKNSALFEGSQIKAVLLQRLDISGTESNSNTFVKINSDLEENAFNYMNTGHAVSFPKEFLDCLKSNGINLVLTSESVNDIKKAQLNSIGCSLIAYIDCNLIEYLNSKLDLIQLNSKSDQGVIEHNTLSIQSIENLGNDMLHYFK